MKRPRYRTSAKAVEDLNRIWQFTFETWSIEQADRFITRLLMRSIFLAATKLNGKPFDPVGKGYCASIAKSHVIFYRIQTDEIIEVIRILHQRMDIKSRLHE